MIRLDFANELEYEVVGQPADFVRNIHASRTPWQRVVSERLAMGAPLEHRVVIEGLLRPQSRSNLIHP